MSRTTKKAAAKVAKPAPTLSAKTLAKVNARWKKGVALAELAKPLGLTWQQLVGQLVAAGYKSDRKRAFRIAPSLLAKIAARWHRGKTLAELAKPHKASWQQLAGTLIVNGYRADGRKVAA